MNERRFQQFGRAGQGPPAGGMGDEWLARAFQQMPEPLFPRDRMVQLEPGVIAAARAWRFESSRRLARRIFLACAAAYIVLLMVCAGLGQTAYDQSRSTAAYSFPEGPDPYDRPIVVGSAPAVSGATANPTTSPHEQKQPNERTGVTR